MSAFIWKNIEIATAKVTIFHQFPPPLLVVACPLFKALRTDPIGRPARDFATQLPANLPDVNRKENQWKKNLSEKKWNCLKTKYMSILPVCAQDK